MKADCKAEVDQALDIYQEYEMLDAHVALVAFLFLVDRALAVTSSDVSLLDVMSDINNLLPPSRRFLESQLVKLSGLSVFVRSMICSYMKLEDPQSAVEHTNLTSMYGYCLCEVISCENYGGAEQVTGQKLRHNDSGVELLVIFNGHRLPSSIISLEGQLLIQVSLPQQLLNAVVVEDLIARADMIHGAGFSAYGLGFEEGGTVYHFSWLAPADDFSGADLTRKDVKELDRWLKAHSSDQFSIG